MQFFKSLFIPLISWIHLIALLVTSVKQNLPCPEKDHQVDFLLSTTIVCQLNSVLWFVRPSIKWCAVNNDDSPLPQMLFQCHHKLCNLCKLYKLCTLGATFVLSAFTLQVLTAQFSKTHFVKHNGAQTKSTTNSNNFFFLLFCKKKKSKKRTVLDLQKKLGFSKKKKIRSGGVAWPEGQGRRKKSRCPKGL